MSDFNINNTYWERIRGFVSELRVDSRWILRSYDDDKSYGSLRIVSHPDLKPGHLRAYFTYIISMKNKSMRDKLQTVEDYEIDIKELEIYSIDNHIETETKIYEAPLKELQELFNVKVFE